MVLGHRSVRQVAGVRERLSQMTAVDPAAAAGHLM
jgi:hypothetical protein